MANPLSRAYHVAANEGPASLFRKGLEFLLGPLPTRESMQFMIADRNHPGPNADTIGVTLRQSTLDSDTLGLLADAENAPEIGTVYAIVDSMADFEAGHAGIRSKLEALDVDIRFVEDGTEEARKAVLESWVLFLRNGYDLLECRQTNRNPDRTFVRLLHGFGKADGPFRERNGDISGTNPLRPPDFLTPIDYYLVSGDMELFYRSASKEKHPSKFLKCGYPKYSRLWRLQDGRADPILPDETRERLDEDGERARVLYAPTHKGTYEPTELFPFDEFDVETLCAELEALDAVLYIRMHLHEEEAGIYDEYIDGERIKYAGHRFSPSATEILPSFDALITDYSSIYTEYLALDRPILFVIDESNPYWTNKGLAFEEEAYVPGPKINSFESFTTELAENLADESRFGSEREFAATALLPDREPEFLQCIFQKFDYR